MATGRPAGGEISGRRFATAGAWAKWLEAHHASSDGVWLRLAKKGAGLRSISYAEALEEALCFGWIDAQKRPESEQAWLQRFTPRKAKSIWSKINREKALRLMEAGRMRPAGLAQVESARRDGRWEQAYDSPAQAAVPEDLRMALNANPEAQAFFGRLDRANRYAVLWRIQTAKRAETRARRVEQFVAMLARGEKLH